jgi:hypothetical protein
MKLAIMQPYFFPYLGYWQLIHAVDRFVIYDDVNYIKGGWVNRNRILINGKPAFITAPLHQSSPFKRICDIELHPSLPWRDKLVKMVDTTYRRAPHFEEAFPIVEKLIRCESNNLSDYLTHQLQSLSATVGITTEFVVTSRCYANGQLSGQDRLLDICAREGAHGYINLRGGQSLYNNETFRNAGITLRFIGMRGLSYPQRTAGFVPSLSIIDALMEIGSVGMKEYLDAFDLIEPA